MGCYQNDAATFHYQVGTTLSLLYPYVEDEAGKLAILDHFAKRPADILSLLKQGDIRYMFRGDTQGKTALNREEDLLLEAVHYQANYLDILYGIDALRYAEEYTAYIDQLYPIWESDYSELKDDKNKVIGYLDFMSFLIELEADKPLIPYILDKQANSDIIKMMKALQDKYCFDVDEERTYVGLFEHMSHEK